MASRCRHLLLRRLLLAGLALLAGAAAAGAAEPNEKIPIRFMSRSATADEGDSRRLDRAQESRGYRAAQEMVWEALGKRATDIHLEPSEDQMLVRLRVDGMMGNATPFSRSM